MGERWNGHTHIEWACEDCGVRIGGCRCIQKPGLIVRKGLCPGCAQDRANATKAEVTR